MKLSRRQRESGAGSHNGSAAQEAIGVKVLNHYHENGIEGSVVKLGLDIPV